MSRSATVEAASFVSGDRWRSKFRLLCVMHERVIDATRRIVPAPLTLRLLMRHLRGTVKRAEANV